MRKLDQSFDNIRLTDGWTRQYYGGIGDHTCGAFKLASVIDACPMLVVASSDGGWEHVSVSRPDRCPYWVEMEQVKQSFFSDNEIVMQLHVPKGEHINNVSTCLHLWKPKYRKIMTPPAELVGIPGITLR